VRAWTPPAGADVTVAGGLHVRAAGDGEQVTVLLHGLLGTNLAWGGTYDVLARDSRLLVPDLLGFGASLDADRSDHSLDAHLDALDAMLEKSGAGTSPLTIVGHSLGALVGLLWAQRRPSTVRVVCCNPPLFDGPDDAERRIAALGPLNKVMALDTGAARAFCRLRWQHRRIAEWIAVAALPHLPVPVARASMAHVWDSYLGGLDIIRTGPWRDAISELEERDVPVLLCEAAGDPVRVDGLATSLEDAHANVTGRLHPDGGHDLPMADPGWLLDAIQRTRC
jgi:pimeloyl-ACP methyl ester carboxylesterase